MNCTQAFLLHIGPLEKDDINTKLENISKKVDGIKVEVFETLQKKFSEFHPDLKAAMQLNDRAQSLAAEMDTMAVKIEKEVSLIVTLLYYLIFTSLLFILPFIFSYK